MLLSFGLTKRGKDGSPLTVWVDPEAVMSLREGVRRTHEGWQPVMLITLGNDTRCVVNDSNRDVAERIIDALPSEAIDDEEGGSSY